MATVVEIQRDLGDQVRRLRIDLDLTQEHVADRANIAIKTVAALENGRGSTLPTLIRVLRVLDRDDWFSELNPHEGPSPLELLRTVRNERPRQRVRRAQG